MLQAAPFFLSRDVSFPLYKDLLPSTMQPFLSRLSGLIVEARDYCVRRHSWAFSSSTFQHSVLQAPERPARSGLDLCSDSRV
jgi:hypothetical protein